MHESPRRGVLLMPNGAPMLSISLARILGIPVPKMVKVLDRLSAVGVSSREDETGALTNRRMVRDEHVRQVRTEAGKLGGNPDLLKQKPSKDEPIDDTDDKQKPTPSSPSPSSSPPSKKEPPASPAYAEDFERFWNAYPRKIGKGDAFTAWRKNGHPGIEALESVLARARSTPKWIEENGRFIPKPATWLNQKRWDDEYITVDDEREAAEAKRRAIYGGGVVL